MFMNLSVAIIIIIIFTAFSNLIYSDDRVYKDYTDVGYIEESNLKIKQVLESPDKFHRDIITLEGEIGEIEYKQLINGRKFTIFKLKDIEDNNIKVYARGLIKGISKGTNIRIMGRYSKEKSFFFKKYKNVMKARKVHVLES